MDGTHTNVKAFEKLGASINPDSPLTSFKHPCDPNELIFVVMDPPHMLKLIRNVHKDVGQLISLSGTIDFKYYVMLVEIQYKLNLKLGTKINKRHVENKDGTKMKTKNAAQLYSLSVASAMKFLQELGVESFTDCEATIEFTITINNIFDFLNCHSPNQLGLYEI